MTNKNAYLKQENRRFELRLALPLSVLIEGTQANGQNFSEKTFIENISSTGAYFRLQALVTVGTKLLLKIELPSSLSEGKKINLRLPGQIIRLEKTVTNGNKQGVALNFNVALDSEEVQFITEDS